MPQATCRQRASTWPPSQPGRRAARRGSTGRRVLLTLALAVPLGLVGPASGPSASGEAGPTGALAHPPPDFPRLGGSLIGTPHNYDEPAYQDQIARLDLVVLGMYNGWNGGGAAQAVAAIKARNPAILLANYTIMTEVFSDSSDSSTQYKRDKLGSEVGPNGIGDWWAYDENGEHTDWSGGTYDAWDTNLTLLTTPDANGDRWPQWLARADYERLFEGVGFDLWYSDNNFWRPRSDADWDRDGSDDDRDDPAVRAWWRDGQRAHYDAIRDLAPDLLLMLNADSDLDGGVFPPEAEPFGQYEYVAHAAFMEHAMGKDWSVETWGGWALTMDWYRRLRTNLLEPKIVLFDVFLPSPTDYQYLRYAFGSCLLGDGYFSASTDYNEIHWFDEFDLAGTASTKWLGQALDPPPTSAWQHGVYRRRFEHGMVLVNPKGNGPQTVTVEPGYRRFLGTQAPEVNNGMPVTSLTLADRDGILLVRTEPVGAAPGPSAPALVLAAPAPNPASEHVALRFTLPRPGPARLAVYDLLGREVAVLVDGTRASGRHEVLLDVRRLTPGRYLVRLEAGGRTETRSVTVAR